MIICLTLLFFVGVAIVLLGAYLCSVVSDFIESRASGTIKAVPYEDEEVGIDSYITTMSVANLFFIYGKVIGYILMVSGIGYMVYKILI